MNKTLFGLVKELQFQTPLRKYFFPRFVFNFTAPQLCFLCRCIEETRGCDGSLAEIGCFSGSTTVFLNKFMDAEGIDKPYYALDTFSGFVTADVQHEVTARGKSAGFFTGFSVNKKKWFDATMRLNDISRVRSIQADVNCYDLSSLAPLSFALLDVDLYRPMRKALPELYSALSPGGMIVVDDCDSRNMRWDGSDQAYKEFLASIGQPVQIVHGKLGLLRKPGIRDTHAHARP